MADLSKMFAKKSETPSAAVAPATQVVGVADSGVTQPVSPAGSAQASVAPKPANPFARKSDGGTSGNDSAGAGGIVGADSGVAVSDSQPRPAFANAFARAAAQPATVPAESLVDAPITNLDDLANSLDAGTPTRERVSGFSDETPASEPTRELPADITKEQLGFVDLINGVYHVIHEPDLMGGAIRSIIMELGSHPEYMKLVAPDDIRVWVRGMRDSMGLAQVKKQESKAKRAGGPRAAKNVDIDMLADLDSLGIVLPE